MEELLHICKIMLDNANLDIQIEIPSSTIILDFVVGGSLENIILRCMNYTRLRIAKYEDEDQCFFVGETCIELITSETTIRELYKEDGWIRSDKCITSPTFRVRCNGSILIDIVCNDLAWNIDGGEFKSIPILKITP